MTGIRLACSLDKIGLKPNAMSKCDKRDAVDSARIGIIIGMEIRAEEESRFNCEGGASIWLQSERGGGSSGSALRNGKSVGKSCWRCKIQDPIHFSHNPRC